MYKPIKLKYVNLSDHSSALITILHELLTKRKHKKTRCPTHFKRIIPFASTCFSFRADYEKDLRQSFSHYTKVVGSESSDNIVNMIVHNGKYCTLKHFLHVLIQILNRVFVSRNYFLIINRNFNDSIPNNVQ